jgi:peptide/nickel transport system ATP-binding protein
VTAQPSETQPAPLLEIRDLSVTYSTGKDKVRAVREVSLNVHAGEMVGIAGESGSGKTTLALSLLRLLPPSSVVTGGVMFYGEDLLTANWARLRAVRWAEASVVFQGALSALHPVRTVGEQICEPILLHSKATNREARARTAELLDSVGVPAGRATSYPHELSGGQRQRVRIAMALACDPNLIIADEPTTALDVIVQAQIVQLLADLVRDTECGLIMISHDLSLLAETCDRLAVMYAGRIVELGPSQQLVDDPRHPYTRALSQAFPRIGDEASRLAPSGLPGDPPDLRIVAPGCAFEPRCPEAVAECRVHDIELWPAGDDRESACIKVVEPALASPGDAAVTPGRGDR